MWNAHFSQVHKSDLQKVRVWLEVRQDDDSGGSWIFLFPQMQWLYSYTPVIQENIIKQWK